MTASANSSNLPSLPGAVELDIGQAWWGNASRLDLGGQAAGIVTAAQAMYAKQQALRQRSQDRRNRAKSKAPVPAPVADTVVEQTTD